MTDYTDLVKRLRMTTKYVAFHGRISALRDNREGPEAADAIEAQAARIKALEAYGDLCHVRIAELEAALRPALRFIENTESELGIELDSGIAARAALEGK